MWFIHTAEQHSVIKKKKKSDCWYIQQPGECPGNCAKLKKPVIKGDVGDLICILFLKWQNQRSAKLLCDC